MDFQRNPSPFLDIQDVDTNTPLLVACIRGHYQVAELLLQRGAGIQIQNNRSDGGSPLHEAIYRRHEHMIALLLRFRADPFVENCKSFTPMDFACQTKNVELLRRLESQAPWKGWLELKVPIAMGFATEWKRRWVVICHRLPSPFAPANRRRTHVSLLCYKTTNDTIPECRVWLDGARAVEVTDNPRANARTNGRTPAQMELKLHRSHSAPSGCTVTGSAQQGYSLHFRPDEGTFAGCSELRTWAEVVNNRGQTPSTTMAVAPSGQIPPIPTSTSGGGVVPLRPGHYPNPAPPQPLSPRPIANPQFSPLSQGVSGGFPGGSGSIVSPPPPPSGAARPAAGTATGTATAAARPTSTTNAGDTTYPTIHFQNNPVSRTDASAPPQPPPSFYPPPPPLPTGSNFTASNMPSAPTASFSPFGNLHERANPSAAPGSSTAGAGQGRVVSEGHGGGDDVTGSKVVNECCICFDKNPTHGFVHGNT